MKKSIKAIISSCLLSSILGGCFTYLIISKSIKINSTIRDEKELKFRKYYQLTNQWLLNKNQNKSIEKYLNDHGYVNIAIYGMGELGNRLYEELQNTNINIKYAIDKYPDNNYSNLVFYELNNKTEYVDVIIVTPIFDYEIIESELKKVNKSNIISLEEIIYNIM